MDVEGAEYDTLPGIMRYLEKINGMVIEFHNLMKYEKKFIKLRDELLDEFYIIHVHGCNFDRLIENTNIPNTMEITFINKKMINGNITLSKKNYPVKGLDLPDNPFKEDYILEFKSKEKERRAPSLAHGFVGGAHRITGLYMLRPQ
jgi:hypothetical protein